ncbi:MAG: aldehyde dehydrogenase family protein [Chlorobiaceae bacterium]|nr:aldehyde dehydrogenase family protein [Chlorobiaceae bacterium]
MQERLSQLRRTFESGTTSGYSWRRAQLLALQRFLVEKEKDIADAVRRDFGKSNAETFLTETAFVRGEVRHCLLRLRKWMRPERVFLPLHYQFGRASIEPRPLGTALVIGAWNYPVNICLSPLVGALAAGNCVVLKPSEHAPHTSRIIAEGIAGYLDETAVAVFQGGVEETKALLGERFDCIFYTGSRRVGAEIMHAASRSLIPVILELGGKSPCIVEKDACIRTAARRIVWAKFLNAGQTCIAPDYLLVHRDAAEELFLHMKEAIGKFYGPDPEKSADYPRIVSERHFDRLESFMGTGEIVTGGTRDRKALYISPTVISGVSPDDPVMMEEIFGPVLPVMTYETIDEALALLRLNPDPLAVYLFTSDNAVIRSLSGAIRSGGFCINDLLFQSAIHGLPFGGTGASGFGRYHGKAGFDAFSYRRSMLQRSNFPDPDLRYPPYGRLKFGLLRKIVEMFDY